MSISEKPVLTTHLDIHPNFLSACINNHLVVSAGCKSPCLIVESNFLRNYDRWGMQGGQLYLRMGAEESRIRPRDSLEAARQRPVQCSEIHCNQGRAPGETPSRALNLHTYINSKIFQIEFIRCGRK
jgi:hypothetical protein